MTFDDTLRDGSSFVKLTFEPIKRREKEADFEQLPLFKVVLLIFISFVHQKKNSV